MNLKTGILLIVFAVALGGVIVGQRLQIRSVAFEAGKVEKQVRVAEKENLVLRVERTRKSDPYEMIRRVRDSGINLLPPEQKDPPPVAEKPGSKGKGN